MDHELFSGYYNGTFHCIIGNIKVDLITRPNNKILLEETIENFNFEQPILLSHSREILIGKLWCCLNSNEDFIKERHIEELNYLLSNNVKLLKV